ncbi:hypothetical protein S245_044036, partial [Arachis hypogaea]
LFKNEFEGLKFTNKNNNDQVGEHMKNISGEEMRRDLWEVEICHSKWEGRQLNRREEISFRKLKRRGK